MYYPYFRGKQYELITIRETASVMAASQFVPIIEPVKEALGGLKKTLDSVIEAEGNAIVIVNPFHGDHSGDGDNISDLLKEHFAGKANIIAGILLKGGMTVKEILACYNAHKNHPLALVHAGFSDAKNLADVLGTSAQNMQHVFFEPDCGKLYRKHFQSTNRNHPDLELFSDLHATFPEEGMTGFGDFLIVGNEYSETGGPAYAIAIHLTYIDSKKDEAMYIFHFKSTRQDTPKDPAGKFAEALERMMQKLDEPGSQAMLSKSFERFTPKDTSLALAT
jgi:hypothetical protein